MTSATSGIARPDPASPRERPARRGKPRGSALATWLPPVALSAIAVAMGALKLAQRTIGGWDSFAFLCNAIDMAGRSVGYIEPSRPPLVPFLTSLVMRMGVWNETSIQIAEVTLSLVGVVALYFLLARRFPTWMAVAGSLLLMSMPPLWAWLGTGYTDFPSVALSICAILAVVKATEDDPRWYWAAFSLLIAAVLTRLGTLVMVVPVFVWLILRARFFQDARYIAQGILAAILAYLPAGLYFQQHIGDFAFPLQVVGSVAAGDFAAGGELAPSVADAAAFVVPGHWYFENIRTLIFPAPMGILATLLLIAAALGLVVAAAAALSPARTGWRWLAPLCAAAVAIAAQVSGGSAVRMLTIVGLGLAAAWATRPRTDDDAPQTREKMRWALDAVVMTWGLAFLDAHGHMEIQIDRYFLMMAPAVVYFLLIGWRAMTGLLVRSLAVHPPRLHEADTRIGAAWANGIVAVALVLVTATALYFTISSAPPANDPLVADAAASAVWLRTHDPSLRRRIVYSDLWPLTSWYLGQKATAMPTFTDAPAFAHELEKNRVDYFMNIRGGRYPGYEPAHTSGSVVVLKRTSPFRETMPTVAYLGGGWGNYLERLSSYDFQLMTTGRGLPTGAWRLDSLDAGQLARYDAVAIYGARWRSSETSQRILREYVERGGVIVIDASHNMSGLGGNLVDTVFLGMLIARTRVAPDARITLEGGLTTANGATATVDAAPFLDETGGPWFGAEYRPLDPKMRLQVLARLGGRPVIQLQRIGRGRIYWVGDNLMWHAFLKEVLTPAPKANMPETDLVRGVMRAALDLPPLSPLSSREPSATGSPPTDTSR